MSGAASYRRGRCRWCARLLALTQAGRVRRHNQRGTTTVCEGSGQVPA